MLKTLVTAAMFLMILPSLSQAAAAGGSDSCGAGWYITKNKSLSATTTRGTTNMTIPPSLGMTSGTLECERHDIAEKEMDAVKFAVTNVDSLSVDIAVGSGEYIEAFSASLGCNETEELSQALRQNYSELIPSSNTSGIELYKNVRQLIRNNKSLSSACPNAA